MDLQRAEVGNAFRLRKAQDRLTSEEIFRALAQYDRDSTEGIYENITPDWEKFFRIFEQISQKSTARDANLFADILHVASALTVESQIFLAFDKRQARLAALMGPRTPMQSLP